MGAADRQHQPVRIIRRRLCIHATRSATLQYAREPMILVVMRLLAILPTVPKKMLALFQVSAKFRLRLPSPHGDAHG